MEHRTQLDQFRCYYDTAASVRSIFSTLSCEGDGWVSHENFDVVRKLIVELEETWDESVTCSPFPFKDGEHSYFLS